MHLKFTSWKSTQISSKNTKPLLTTFQENRILDPYGLKPFSQKLKNLKITKNQFHSDQP